MTSRLPPLPVHITQRKRNSLNPKPTSAILDTKLQFISLLSIHASPLKKF